MSLFDWLFFVLTLSLWCSFSRKKGLFLTEAEIACLSGLGSQCSFKSAERREGVISAGNMRQMGCTEEKNQLQRTTRESEQ